MRKCILLLTIIMSSSFGLIHGADDFDMEAEELRKEVNAMNSIVEPVFNNTVHNYIKWYMEGPEGYTNSMMQRSAMYFPYIERELQLAGLPDDLKYLVVIESSVKPEIRSHMGAVGLWQLMVPTARYCGLTIDYFIDERMDPQRSTKAAIIYLKELYAQFGDWSLVMAAYNGGPGRLRKAIRRSGSKDYWEVSRYLPRETRRYVPKFIAAQYFFSKMYNEKVVTAKVPNDLLFSTEVRLTQPTSLSEVSKVTDVSLEMLEQLNSFWRRSHIGNSSGRYTLRLPMRVVDRWLEYDREREEYISELEGETEENKMLYSSEQYYLKFDYPVQRGEGIEDIASLFDLNPILIRWWNKLDAIEEVKKGQSITLIVPHNGACTYIKDIIEDAEDIDLLEANQISEIQRSPMPLSNNKIEIAGSDKKREDEVNPVIVPRGMSLAQYVNFKS